jgi:elongation factor Ts
MSKFTTADIKRLRDETGAGMMDCKRALEETEGDFDAAVELLRAKGAQKVAKRGAERTASNGIVVAHDGALLEINCETDFVAKNDQFQELGRELVTVASTTKASTADELVSAKTSGGNTAGEALDALAAVIGEKLAIGRLAAFQGKTEVYLHRRASDLPPQVGVLVAYEGDDADAARAVAMQIAAMGPRYVTREDVPADVVEAERAQAAETARGEGKPEHVVPRIVDGRLNKFLRDTVLAEQPSIHDDDKTAGQVLTAAGIKVTRFAHFEVGQP